MSGSHAGVDLNMLSRSNSMAIHAKFVVDMDVTQCRFRHGYSRSTQFFEPLQDFASSRYACRILQLPEDSLYFMV